MILVPEQIKGLRKNIRESKERLKTYNSYFADMEIVASEDTARSIVGNDLSNLDFSRERENYLSLIKILERAKFLQKRDTTCVNIGTKFKVLFLEEGEVEEFMLLESLDGVTMERGFISINSPIGQALYKKEIGDIVSYKVGNSEIKVKVLGISKDKNDYLGYIRDAKFSNRANDKELSKLKELKESDPVEYRNRQAITPSQVDLLEKEVNDLIRDIQKTNSSALKCRLTTISKILKDKNVSCGSDDDSIDIGSRFTVTISNKDGILKEYEVEMINKAVSTEVVGEYIERASSIGKRLYGLREGEMATYKDFNNNTYILTVSNIYNYKNKKGYSYTK